MTAAELEQFCTAIIDCCQTAEADYAAAVAAEQYPNDATQDILHIAELAPSQLTGVDIVAILHSLRETRRAAKQELEVTQIFHDWVEDNKQAINKLKQALGAMRKVLRRQPHDAYHCRTSIIGEKDSWLATDPEPNRQITIFELLQQN